jgi:uncharacterized protein (DUF1330 family)
LAIFPPRDEGLNNCVGGVASRSPKGRAARLCGGKIMSAYVVYVRDRITDPEEFSRYEESAAAAASIGHPGTPLAFYGAVETLEGERVDGAVILEFPTIKDAKAAYNSPLYQGALQHRLKGAEYRVFMVEGISRKSPEWVTSGHLAGC